MFFRLFTFMMLITVLNCSWVDDEVKKIEYGKVHPFNHRAMAAIQNATYRHSIVSKYVAYPLTKSILSNELVYSIECYDGSPFSLYVLFKRVMKNRHQFTDCAALMGMFIDLIESFEEYKLHEKDGVAIEIFNHHHGREPATQTHEILVFLQCHRFTSVHEEMNHILFIENKFSVNMNLLGHLRTEIGYELSLYSEVINLY